MNADELLNRVLDVYQNCSSYSDAGEVVGDLGNLEFKTYFCRPNKFRFEWSKPFNGRTRRGVIFSESETKATYFDGENLEDTGGLALAVAGATGISLGVAPRVAHLLMPNLFGTGKYESLVSLRPYNFVEESDSYIKIRADWRSNCWTTLFVDKMKPALRGIEEGFTPTLEEKKRGFEAMQLTEDPELEEVRALLLVEETPKETMISYGDVKFDMPISLDLFRVLDLD